MFHWIKRRLWWMLLAIFIGGVSYAVKRGILFDDDCWSPNHEYFMVRKQSLWSAMFSQFGYEEGWVLVYDKYGNLVHRWDGDLTTQGGPFWTGNEVLILNKPEASLRLPTDAGEGDLNRICY